MVSDAEILFGEDVGKLRKLMMEKEVTNAIIRERYLDFGEKYNFNEDVRKLYKDIFGEDYARGTRMFSNNGPIDLTDVDESIIIDIDQQEIERGSPQEIVPIISMDRRVEPEPISEGIDSEFLPYFKCLSLCNEIKETIEKLETWGDNAAQIKGFVINKIRNNYLLFQEIFELTTEFTTTKLEVAKLIAQVSAQDTISVPLHYMVANIFQIDLEITNIDINIGIIRPASNKKGRKICYGGGKDGKTRREGRIVQEEDYFRIKESKG